MRIVAGALQDALRYRPRPVDLRNLAGAAGIWIGGFAAALLWMTFGPFALFPPAGYIDPWFYVGYFTNFSYLFSHAGMTYYVSRLPWIIPGRAAFAVAPPATASLLLCAAIVSVSAVSLYWVVRWHYGQTPAIIAAIAFGSNPYFMAAASWHYPDGPAIAYASIALAFYLRPRGHPTNSVLGAAALALSGFTNMSGAPMILSVLLIPFWRNRRSLGALFREALYAAAGVALATLVLAGISKVMLHDPLFFLPQIRMFLFTERTPSYLAHMWGTGADFLLTGFRLFLPADLLAVGLALLIAIRRPAGPAWTLYLSALTCLALYSFDQFVRHGVTLRVSYTSSYMVVPVFGLGGALLGELWNRGRRGRTAGIVFAAAALALPVIWNRWRPPYIPFQPWMPLAGIAVAGLALALLTGWPQLPVRAALCSVLLVSVFLGPAIDPALQYVWANRPIWHGSNLSHGDHADSWRFLIALQKDLNHSVDPARSLHIWWHADEPIANLALSESALYLEGFRDFKKDLSTGSRADLEQFLSPGATLVHLSLHSDRIREGDQLLISRGVALAPELRSHMDFKGASLIVSLQDVTDVSHLR